jgi:ubiquinone/menaquinone biosynthesis C-methylase UbiE
MDGGFGKVYREIGVARYYEKSGEQYSNPHKFDIERLIKRKLSIPNSFLKKEEKILDLACGSGEATIPLLQLGYNNITGVDPYTHLKYEEMTKLKCPPHSFIDILNGALDEERYDAIIVSYALHLVKESMLHNFCHKLAEISKKLIIVSPHKFPIMK